MQVNLIASKDGFPKRLKKFMHAYGFEFSKKADITFFINLCNLNSKHWNQKFNVAFACGSDVWLDWNNLSEAQKLLKKCDLVLYSHPEMHKKTGVNGYFWNVPFDSKKFCLKNYTPKREVLIYCPRSDAYDINKVNRYILSNPEKKISVISEPYAFVLYDYPSNVAVYSKVPYKNMPKMIDNHRIFRVWLKTPASLIGILECECLACGLKVFRNDVEVNYIPRYMYPEVAMERLKSLFLSLHK